MNPIKFKSRIISALRKLSYSWEPRKNVSNAAKRAPATFECENCSKWCYTGKSTANFDKLKEEFPNKNLQMERIDIDHKIPVLSIEYGFTDWNDLVNGIFCSEDNLWAICKTCHDIKTNEETRLRTKYRNERKKSK